MFAIIGIVVTIASVIGGYTAAGGHLDVLWQPFEFIIILGAAFGSMFLGNPKDIVMGVFKKIGMVFKGAHYKRDASVPKVSRLFQRPSHPDLLLRLSAPADLGHLQRPRA
jgi:chemotaxis protein MotA